MLSHEMLTLRALPFPSCSSTGGATATPITPASAAPYCLARMRKLMRTGARKHVPVLAEIAAVESMEPVKIQLLLPDDTTQVRARGRGDWLTQGLCVQRGYFFLGRV